MQPTALNAAETDTAASQTNSAWNTLPLFTEAIPRSMPAALRGSHAVLVHQNIIADVEGLSRIQNEAQLNAMVHDGDLVPLPVSSALEIDPRLPVNRRYCRPWTAKFLSDLSRAHANVFGRSLRLTSAVRTVDFQRHLSHYNANAAPTSGDTASPHLTGEAIDLSKKGMSQHEIAWMRAVLGRLQQSGRLDVEEEFKQACFHISVYRIYVPRSNLPTSLIARNETAPEDTVSTNDGAEAAPIGGIVRDVDEPARTRIASRHVRRHTVHRSRRTIAHRHGRQHRATMSLLAARMR